MIPRNSCKSSLVRTALVQQAPRASKIASTNALSAETGAGMGSSNKVSGRKRKDKLSVDTGSFGMIRYPRTDAKAAAPSMEK